MGGKCNEGVQSDAQDFRGLASGMGVPLRVTRGCAWYCFVHGVNKVTEDLSGAMRRRLVIDQSEIGVKSAWRREERIEVSGVQSGCETAKVRSSAYDVIISAVAGQSWRNQLNKVGEITEP